jgi:hypothetical protein
MSPAAANLGSVSAASANVTTSGSGVHPENSAREMINAALARCCSSAFASRNFCLLGMPRFPGLPNYGKASLVRRYNQAPCAHYCLEMGQLAR